MLFTLVKEQRLQMVTVDWLTGDVQMAVSQCLQDGETLATTATVQQAVLSVAE